MEVYLREPYIPNLSGIQPRQRFFYIDKNKRAKGSEGSQVHTYGRALDVKNILKVDIFLSLVCNIIFIFRNCDDE